VNALLFVVTCGALIATAVEGQRHINAQASARGWHRAHEQQVHENHRLVGRVVRLEIALGRRKPGHWVPRGFQAPTGRPPAPTEAELHLWILATDNTPATVEGHPRYTAEPDTVTLVQAGSDAFLRAVRRISTGEVEEVVYG
jgi:hypothetical protein